MSQMVIQEDKVSIYENVQNDKVGVAENKSFIALIQSEICIDGKPMNDKKATAKLLEMFVTCRKNIEVYADAKRTEAVQEEVMFMGLVEKYLPFTPLIACQDDVAAVIESAGVEKSMKCMGMVMGKLKKDFHIVDGNMVKSFLMGKS